MIKIAAVGRYGAGGESAASARILIACAKTSRGVPAEFCRIEQPATIIGEEAREQQLVLTVGVDCLSNLFSQHLPPV
jgi:hypothetical protein